MGEKENRVKIKGIEISAETEKQLKEIVQHTRASNPDFFKLPGGEVVGDKKALESLAMILMQKS